MNLFKFKSKISHDKKGIPLLSIRECLDIYNDLCTREPEFGMDIFAPDFDPKGVVLFENNGLENQGIPIRCNHYVLVLCLKGRIEGRQNQHEFQLTAHTAHLVHPGEIHSFTNRTPDCKLYIMLFRREYLAKSQLPDKTLDDLLWLDPDLSPLLEFERREFDRLLSQLGQIDFELRSENKFRHHLIRHYIISLLYLIKRKLGTASESLPASRQENILKDFRKLIESNFQHTKTVAEYAELMNITSKHLSETVKKVTKQTALYFIQERIIREAQYLLIYTSLNVKQIALKLNFDTPSHFVRFFKHNTAQTPLKYRRSFM